MEPDYNEIGTGSVQSAFEFMLADISQAWQISVRILNTCENSGLNDSTQNAIEIVAKLSQFLEHAQSMAGTNGKT